MSQALEDLQNILPMPLALLVKRAATSATARDRHDAAFYLGEASLKLAAAARVMRLLSLGTPAEATAKKLEGLLLPSTGHWMALLRDATEALAEQNRAPPGGERDPLAERSALSKSRKDFTAIAEFARACEKEQIAQSTGVSAALKNGVFGFFGLLVTYRNRVLGHSGQRLPVFYSEMSELLGNALSEALRVPELFGGLELALAVQDLADGRVSTKLRVLQGLSTTTRKIADAGFKPGTLYMLGGNGYRVPLSPLIVYAESREQKERFGFLNGIEAKAGSDAIKRVEYLDYGTSTPLQEVDVMPQLTELLGKIRGRSGVSAAEVRQTVAALAEELPTEKSGAPPTAASPTTPLVGSTVAGKYRVLQELGQGGMGTVYEVVHVTLETRFAMKVLHAKLARHEEYLQRFEREARGAAQTKHPGIVQVIDHGRLDDGAAYLVMELLEGESLQSRIERAPMSVEETIAVGVSALDALAAAHVRGIVHRDIKPDNLYLPSPIVGAKVKVLDFGIAKIAEGVERLTADGAVLGTPSYIAPEQLGNSRTADARADVYAMGATLFACLTRRPPSDGSDLRVLLANVAQGKIERDVRLARPDTPEWLAQIIIQALAYSVNDRFADAAAMAEAFRGHDVTQQKTIAGTPIDSSGLPPVKRRARWVAIGAGAAALAAVVVWQVASNPNKNGKSVKTDSVGASEGVTARPSASLSAVVIATQTSARSSVSASAEPHIKREPPPGMALVRGGTFVLGLEEGELAELRRSTCVGSDAAKCAEVLERATPATTVTVDDYWLDQTEVTRGAYANWLNSQIKSGGVRWSEELAVYNDTQDRLLVAVETGSTKRTQILLRNSEGTMVSDDKKPMFPMAYVSWLGAETYCRALGKRLPTEAEWERAARGEARSSYVWGDKKPDCNMAVFARAKGDECGPGTTEVQGYHPSAVEVGAADHTVREGSEFWGLGSNVQEWVADYTVVKQGSIRYPPCEGDLCHGYWVASTGDAGKRAEGMDPGGALELRVMRGCHYQAPAYRCLASVRGYNEAFVYDSEKDLFSVSTAVGFRCARNIDE